MTKTVHLLALACVLYSIQVLVIKEPPIIQKRKGLFGNVTLVMLFKCYENTCG